MADFVIIEGDRDKSRVLHHRNKLYKMYKTTSGTTYFRCKVKVCQARGKIRDDGISFSEPTHSCNVNEAVVEEMQFSTKVKNSAEHSVGTIKETYDKESANAKHPVPFQKVYSAMRKRRQRKIPKNVGTQREVFEYLERAKLTPGNDFGESYLGTAFYKAPRG